MPSLEDVGLVLRVREPGHRVFRTPERAVHVHADEPQHAAVSDYLRFRDWLLVSGQDRDLYAATKRPLAGRDWQDMNHYADAKSDVIQDILRRARSWRLRAPVLD